jgi:hypothetical protein
VTDPNPDKPNKRGGSKPGRTKAAAALVVASRARREPPGDKVHEGEHVGEGPRPDEYASTKDRARAICDRVRARRGRPPELTADLIERVVKRILDGSTAELALRDEGFDGDTYWRWRAKAKEDLAKDPPEVTLHVTFYEAVNCAKAAFSQEAAVWLWEQRDTPGAKTSAANVVFLLKCRDPEGHADAKRLEVTGKDGGPVEVADARAEAFARIASAVGADASLFLAEMKRWPSSVEEVEAWRSRRAQATAAAEPPPPPKP